VFNQLVESRIRQIIQAETARTIAGSNAAKPDREEEILGDLEQGRFP